MKSILIFLIILIVQSAGATNFYVSSEGSVKNKGTSPKRPLKTIASLNNIKLKPGDSILFKRNEVFTGELRIKDSGTEKMPVVISSYGKGDRKPVLSGALEISGWAKVEDNIYRVEVKDDVRQLYRNRCYQNVCRFPDKGYFFIDDGDSISLHDDEISEAGNLTGSTVRIQTVNWQWEIREVSYHQESKIKFDSVLWHPCRPDFGYYFENLPGFVNQPGEWYYDEEEKQLTMYWDKNIQDENIEATIYNHGIQIKEGASNIVIKDLSFTMYNISAIHVGSFAKNITIHGNEISNIEVFGVLMDTACNKCVVTDNTISDVLGRGISLLEPQYCSISGNRISRTGMIAGHGFDGVNSGVAICMENVEFRKPGYDRIAMHNSIAYNRIDSTGYGAIRADGAYNTIEYNIVKEAVLTMNDGGGIYCWGKTYDYTHHNIFRKNIVWNVHGNTTTCAGHHKIITCLYMDNYTNHCTVEGNILVGANTGIILNDLSHDHIVRNNMIYDTDVGLSLAVWLRKDHDTIRGHYNIFNNTIYSKGSEQKAIVIGNQLNVHFEPGNLDSNLYVNPTNERIIRKFTNFGGYTTTYDYKIEAWRQFSGDDIHSAAIVPGPDDRPWEMEDESLILVNDTDNKKQFDLGAAEYYNLSGEKVSGEISLDPFEAGIYYK